MSLLSPRLRPRGPPRPRRRSRRRPVAAPSAPAEDPLSRYRASFDVLADSAIGTVSTPVKFDWRRSPVHLAATGSFLFELNNFDSARGGVLTRLPTGGLLLSFELSYVGVWDTPSSRMLALTPYRQPGRPERLGARRRLSGSPWPRGCVDDLSKLLPRGPDGVQRLRRRPVLGVPNGLRPHEAGKIAEPPSSRRP